VEVAYGGQSDDLKMILEGRRRLKWGVTGNCPRLSDNFNVTYTPGTLNPIRKEPHSMTQGIE
jgi:hypothetical protein